MFSKMIARIAKGLPVEPAWLMPRLTMALVKKQGVIRQAPAMWPIDPKINPDTEHLIWAAILLKSKDRFLEVEAVLTMERMQKAGTGRTGAPPEIEGVITAMLDTLLALAPDRRYRDRLTTNIGAILPSRYQYRPEEADNGPPPQSTG